MRFTELGFEVTNGSTEALLKLGVPHSEANREMNESELTRFLATGVEVYVYGGLEPASRTALASAAKLKLIAFLGTGWADPGCIDSVASAEKGILVSNTPHANAHSVAEYALGAMIGAARNMYAMAGTADGKTGPTAGFDLYGKSLAIIGLGAIGSRLARFAHNGLGMRILYFGPSRKASLEQELGAQRVTDLEDLFAQADVVSVHASSTADTRGLVDGTVLAAVTRPIVLVNCAVANIVDGHALYSALRNGGVKTAVFDESYHDGDLTRKLRGLGPLKYIEFPHAAGSTGESYERMTSMSFDCVSAYVKGAPIPYLVQGRQA
ncbi:NAD(P)-dependent oxidoreductase [Catellatospora vulcania]|uniref:NAD(P)-dependent oxidoreductase n=1 Tax=Catellatospora vulcania TaxID=1460450 RepID=UPI0012D402C1|nr:NAD(P)-dependent oxidoreductase [Catellatospora vulcania]